MIEKKQVKWSSDVVAILEKIKCSDLFSEDVVSSEDIILTLVDRIIFCDEKILQRMRTDRDLLIVCINLLTKTNHLNALHTLISHIDISKDDIELLQIVIETGLGGDFSMTHRWMVDYNIVDQRLEMIKSTVLPFLNEFHKDKTLFYALKLYEANCIAFNQTLVNPGKIFEIIQAVKNGSSCLDDTFPSVRLSSIEMVRLTLPNNIFNTILRLAWQSQDYLFDLKERYTPDELIMLIRSLEKVIPTYLIPTHLGYPMGGGESFMQQTCRILSEFGVKCIWVSFLDPRNGWYKSNSLTFTPYYLDLRYAGGNCLEDLQRAIANYAPDLVHAHGGTSDDVMRISVKNRITTMIGYHFWNGLINLGSTSNQHILDNLSEHTLYDSPVKQSKFIWKYVASEFMKEVYEKVGGLEQLNIIHPISDNAQFYVDRVDIGIYVLQVNVAPLKGGKIFLDCILKLGNEIPFMGISSEPDGTGFLSELTDAVSYYPKCKLNSYGNVREFYRDARLVIVPTLVDETFCRVAYEAAMNGIPVCSTRNGFLPMMFGDTGIYLGENSSEWITTIQDLYHDTDSLRAIAVKQRDRLWAIFKCDFQNFTKVALNLIDNSVNKNIGIFTVWGEQGLGNLAHTYTKVLRRVGYKVHIFSFQPYSVIGKSLVNQENANDWAAPANADVVYYSFNNREDVTVSELTQFILVNQIRTLFVPEVCWQVNWERLFSLQKEIDNLSICSIPMIEIVIDKEIPLHNQLASTLYCSKIAETILNKAGVQNGSYLGHGFGQSIGAARLERKLNRLKEREKIRFLHVAGYNPEIRKNTPLVIEAFKRALEQRDDIELTVTSMATVKSYWNGILPKGITILDRCFSREEILELYEEHDVSIQVSSHEGLGLGFFESISRCTPVLSLNAPPHNEIVLEGKTGWLISVSPVDMVDNQLSVVSSWKFNIQDLSDKIVMLDRDEIYRVSCLTDHIYRTHFDEVSLLTRFLKILPIIQPGWGGEQMALAKHQFLSDMKPSIHQLILRRMKSAYLYFRVNITILSNLMTSKNRYFGNHIKFHPLALRALAKRLNLSVVNKIRKRWFSSGELKACLHSNLALMHDIKYDLEFMKSRIASYAGEGVVLTYLKDESPIFVNTGDLGCPSPIINGGLWEPENLSVLYSFVRDDSVFLDIGANVGYFSIALGNRVKNRGRVYAFEPHPKLTNLIERSVQLNSLESTVQIFQCAISDVGGSLELFYPEDHLGKGSALSNSVGEDVEPVKAIAYRMDDLLPQDLVVDLVKIDVEGHELQVLKGMREILQRSPNVKILFEKLKASDNQAEEIAAILYENNLSLYGVCGHAVLKPLNLEDYQKWIGDVLAAPSRLIGSLSRTGFSIYPGQLNSSGTIEGKYSVYKTVNPSVVFFGPSWYLRQGKWKVILHGQINGAVQILVVKKSNTVIAALEMSDSCQHGIFYVEQDVVQFEFRACADKHTTIRLERFELQLL